MHPTSEIRGFQYYHQLLDGPAQAVLLADLRAVAKAAPVFSPETPYGKPMSVRMTSAGRVGWFSDRSGYRYVDRHPSGAPWPEIPQSIMAVWDKVSKSNAKPDCCLVNFYGEGARMGMHRDHDEADYSHPVISISLGDEGLFRIGNTTRGGKTESLWLRSGDVMVMGGRARLAYHGVDRIRFGSSALLEKGGRINVTLRVVR